jgi:hypothetical protein
MPKPIQPELIRTEEGVHPAYHDLIHELSHRLRAFPRYDQYVANASENETLRQFWLTMRSEEQQEIELLEELLTQEMHKVTLA